MSRDRLTRMDIDTGWAYHRKQRRLQQLYPEKWPTYWCAYLALLGEAWAVGSRRLTLGEAWVPTLPCQPDEALEALRAAHIVDADGRIPHTSWTTWYKPAAERIGRASDKGRKGAQERWRRERERRAAETENADATSQSADATVIQPSTSSKGDSTKSAEMIGAQPMPRHRSSNAPRQPRQPTTPSTSRGRARGNGSNEQDERASQIARAEARLNDPAAPDSVKAAARFQLDRLGAPAR